MIKKRRGRRTVAVVAVGAALVIMSACSSATSTGTTSSKSQSTAQSSALNFVFVGAGPLSNGTFADENRGAQQAGKDLNVSVQYLGPPVANTQASTMVQLLNDAQAKHPNGYIISDVSPAAMDPIIQQIVKTGTPVVFEGSGQSSVAKDGALSFVGTSDLEIGQIAGSKLNTLGCKHLLAVALIKGQEAYSDDTVTGLHNTFKGTITTTAIPLADSNDVPTSAGIVSASLTKDSSIDCVFSIGVSLYEAMLSGMQHLGARSTELAAHSGSARVTSSVLQDIKSQKVTFAVNPQNFSWGYYSTVVLANYLRYGQLPPALFDTGTQVVTAGNVNQVTAQFAKLGLS